MYLAFYIFSLSHAGGAERMIVQLASAMAERGNRVFLVSLDKPGTKSYYQIHSFVEWIQLDFRLGFIDKMRRTFCLYRKLKENDIQILTGFVMSGDQVVYAAVKLAGVCLIVAERNSPDMYWHRYNSVYRKTIFLLLRLADCITVQMPGFKEKYPVVLRDHIEVIPNPVMNVNGQADPFSAGSSGKYTLLAVSRLDKIQKRLDLLLKAFARLIKNHPDWELRIIGNGPEEQNLREIVEKMNISGRVIIEPSWLDISAAYMQAHLFVMPSLWEGFPNALAEAMSHGLPAVGFEDASGVADLIGSEGWLAKGLYSERALADALSDAMANPKERMRRGSAAAKKMAQFSPDKQFDRWDSLFSSLVKVS
jgi:glycosyltransferase involved in cell wall biosynthesis